MSGLTDLIYLDFNKNSNLSGELPPSLITLCSRDHMYCNFLNNPKMCDDQERMFGFTCSPCINCATNGECYNNFDNSFYTCSSCLSGYYESGGVCLNCDSSSSASSLIVGLSAFGAVLLVIVIITVLMKYNILKPINIKFDIQNQIRLKQIGNLYQMTQLMSILILNIKLNIDWL